MRALRPTLAALATAVSTVACAADYYVSKTGNDSNTGSLASPFLTIARGITMAQSGDTVFVRGGTYNERPNITKSGTASAPFILRAYPGETPVLDCGSLSVPTGAGDEPVIRIKDRSHVIVQGFTIQNWRSSNPNALPEGILINATGSTTMSNIRILNNTIHHVEQNSADTGNAGDAHGIKVAGRSTNAMTGIVIDGNHLHNLRLGTSEALVVNGNVSDWRVTNNRVHDCNNIGIDMIGFENGSLPTSIDRARNGVCAGNVVFNIDARFNPGYGGSFTTGGGDPSAGGIYVDGGTNIIIERNVVFSCNYGIEIASEEVFGVGITDFITLRNNLVHHNHQSGLIMGGYSSSRGTATNCTVNNNTFFQNGTFGATVQMFGQHHVTNNTFRNNIVVSTPNTRLVFGVYPNGAASTFTGNIFSHNLYYSAAGSAEFEVGNTNYSSISSWQAATSVNGGDTGSTAENPLFEEPSIVLTTNVAGYQPSTSSPAINTGQPSPTYQPGSGEQDLQEKSRLRGGRVDRGAIER